MRIKSALLEVPELSNLDRARGTLDRGEEADRVRDLDAHRLNWILLEPRQETAAYRPNSGEKIQMLYL